METQTQTQTPNSNSDTRQARHTVPGHTNGRYMALVHHPVLNKRGQTVTTSVTNLDIHDLSRTGRTYDVDRFFIVTPLVAQHALVKRLLGYWREEESNEYNPDRSDALTNTRLANSLEEVMAKITEREGRSPFVVVTGANFDGDDGDRVALAQRLASEEDSQRPVLVLFGTGWGLTEDVVEAADFKFLPIRIPGKNGKNDYNHLSVRAASAIICDRLWG
jgi:hypothetical protein